MVARLTAGACLLSSVALAEQPTSRWQEEVRRHAEAQNWNAALQVIDQEMAETPGDTEALAWRARVLTWSGKLAEAEAEYQKLLAIAANDPDNWAGAANLYSRTGRIDESVRALEHAVQLDPKRADLHTALGVALRRANKPAAAKAEFQKALDLEPANAEARNGKLSVEDEPKHELRVGVNTDLFSYTGANHDEQIDLVSRWTQRWQTHLAQSTYQRAGINATKFLGSITPVSSRWGALTLGGAAGHDNDIIPKSEAFFDYDHGWRLDHAGPVRGVEVTYGQHWYWYSTARILTLNQTTLLYLPQGWTWSVTLTGARSHFSGTSVEWRPSGVAKLGFPITGGAEHRLDGNMFFATGTENFAHVDQIGRFSSQTYGGGFRFRLTRLQDITGVAAYQKRTQDRTAINFGFTYGIRF